MASYVYGCYACMREALKGNTLPGAIAVSDDPGRDGWFWTKEGDYRYSPVGESVAICPLHREEIEGEAYTR